MPVLLLYSSVVFLLLSHCKHLLKQFLRLWMRPYCNEGKHISLRIHFAHHRHMPAPTILLFTWPFSPLQQHIRAYYSPQGPYLIILWEWLTFYPGWGFRETALKQRQRQANSLYMQFTKVAKTRCPLLKPGHSSHTIREYQLPQITVFLNLFCYKIKSQPLIFVSYCSSHLVAP